MKKHRGNRAFSIRIEVHETGEIVECKRWFGHTQKEALRNFLELFSFMTEGNTITCHIMARS